MIKTCIKCGSEKALNEFESGRNACKECRREYHKSRQIGRKWKYQTKYGITLEDYDEMLYAQNGCCAICGSNDPGGSGKRFIVDHNHQTNEVRGLLCNNCNRALGYFQDSPRSISKALDYLYTNGYYGTT
jgi:hypothetical protein